MQDVVVIGLDLGKTCSLVEPCLRAALLHGPDSEHRRRRTTAGRASRGALRGLGGQTQRLHLVRGQVAGNA